VSRYRTVTKKLLLLSAGLLVGLVVAELGLRVLRISYPLPYAPDPVCGTRLQPGFRGWWMKEGKAFIQINQYGFRHGQRGPDKPPGTLRLAVLGDSFIEAFQVPDEQTFCAVLERELAGCDAFRGRSIEVLNFGVSGYGTTQELLMLREYVWQYDPDLVVLAFFAGNDVRNNSRQLEPYRVRPFYHTQGDQLLLDNSFRQHPDYLRARTATVRCKVALINRIRILQLINHVRSAGPALAEREVANRPWQLGVDLRALLEPQEPAWCAAWELTERLVAEVVEEARRHNVACWLIPIPCDVQVHPDDRVRAECLAESRAEDLLYAERRLIAVGKRCNATVVPLAEPMRQYALQHDVALYGFPNTTPGFGHWNAEGHRVAGRSVAEAICGAWRPASVAKVLPHAGRVD
jgi:hypothetical protein